MNMRQSGLIRVMLYACVGFAGMSCGGPAEQGEQLIGTDALIKMTEVRMGANGKPTTVATHFVTPQQMEMLKQQREEYGRLRNLGAELPTIYKDTGCTDPGGTWVYPNINLGGAVCCLVDYGGAYIGVAQGGEGGLYCGYNNIRSVWTGDWTGYVGNETTDCTQNITTPWHVYNTLTCNGSSDPDYILFY